MLISDIRSSSSSGFQSLITMEVASQSPPPPPPPTLGLIFSQTNRILKSQPRHFLSLGLLFLLPPSVAAAIYPIFFYRFTNAFYRIIVALYGFNTTESAISNSTLLLILAYFLFTSVFAFLSVGSITYSVVNAFHGQPLKLMSAIKSTPASFFRLLATYLLVQVIFASIGFVFVFVFPLLIVGAGRLGFRHEFSPTSFLVLCYSIVIALFLVLIFLQVNWSLSYVVVVAETTWGLAPLKRSWSLIRGKKWLAFSLFLCFEFPLAAFASINTIFVWPALGFHDGVSGFELKKYLIFPLALAVSVLIYSSLRTLILLFEMAATTVLYVYRNNNKIGVVHGDEEFAGKYVSLAVYDDDEKV